MLIVTSQEIAQYRSQLAHLEEALVCLDTLEDCEGNLEDAALSLAIQVGQQPDHDDWLAGMAKRCRVPLCEETVKFALLEENITIAVEKLQQAALCPFLLAPLVVIYVLKSGVEDFCEPLSYKLQ